MKRTGKVYVVGAGPGDMAYLTLRGYTLLRQAQVLVHDALVDERLLAELPSGCDRIDVGKRGGRPSPSQEEIDQLLVQRAQAGKRVVRLKGGDPFIFGRTTSEVQALRQAGCDVEVIPGISSALAAPLLAGIPLTDAVLSHGFAVMTAHDLESLDWPTLAQTQTLVLLMATRRLPEILEQLRQAGKRPETPIAVIRWAGHPQQQVWTGTLLSILQQTKGQSLSPAVVVIGEVVGLRTYLMPSSPTAPLETHCMSKEMETMTAQAPLAGKTVVVTQSAGQSSQFSGYLRRQGATVLEMPALEIRPPSSWQALDDAIASLATVDWLILTSANAVTYFLDRLQHQGHDLRALAGLKIAVVGKKTAQVLQTRGLHADFTPPDFIADSLADTFPEPVQGLTLLFPRVESGGREVLVRAFSDAGAQVLEVPAYESGCPPEPDPQVIQALQQGAVDCLTFASSKTVRHAAQLLEQGLGPEWPTHLPGVCLASIGPKTSETCYQVFGRVDVEAQEYTLEGLTQALVQVLGESR
ncbi:uroporphyrinogen-III C-methyltransferase [Halomicronema hongdechloris]